MNHESLESLHDLIKESRGEFSPRLIAILESIFAIPRPDRVAEPHIGRPCVTSDGFVIADCGGWTGAFMGSWDEIDRNFALWLEHTGLTTFMGRLAPLYLEAWPTHNYAKGI